MSTADRRKSTSIDGVSRRSNPKDMTKRRLFVDIARRHEVELTRHHADHFVRTIVQSDLAAQHVARRAEAPLPQSIADDCHPHASHVFVFSEDASEQRLCAK